MISSFRNRICIIYRVYEFCNSFFAVLRTFLKFSHIFFNSDCDFTYLLKEKGVNAMYDVLQKLLDERGITATDVARETGISRSSMTDWKG